MAKFLALTSKGLGEVVKHELEEHGFKALRATHSSAEFEGSWADCYRANWLLRSATRIVLPVLDFPAYDYDELYHNILRKHDFTKYITPDQTLTIEAATTDPGLKDQRMVAMKAKDAIVDQFWKKFDRRPNVDNERPDLKVLVRVTKSKVSVSIDTTGRPLSFRGYREEQGEAPLREHLAAALIKMTNWDPGLPLVDPMCGSGTLLIEAALWHVRNSPLKQSRYFAYQSLSNFQKPVYEKVKAEIFKNEPTNIPELKLYGYDKNPGVLEIARRNAERAGVEEFITFKHRGINDLVAPGPKGVIVTNPPYGERLDDIERVKDLYLDMGYAFKKGAPGWDVWILSGDPELTMNLKMKAAQKYPVMNGPIECRWVHYNILPPRPPRVESTEEESN